MMNKKPLLQLTLICLFSFLGGLVSPQIFNSPMALAATEEIKEFFDASGKKRLDLGVFNGAPIQDFYDEDGKLRLQFGMYTAPSEKGAPLTILSNSDGKPKLILRLAGKNQSPVIVLKDNNQADRVVLGLALDAEDEAPFLVYFDKDGTKHESFGKY